MKCPNCHEESNIITGDPEFGSLVLKGTQAQVEVVQSQFCESCSSTVKRDRFRGVVEVPEAAVHEEHGVDLRGEGLVEAGDDFEATIRVICSCGFEVERKARVELEEETPWADPA
jgi:hypothetical protein